MVEISIGPSLSLVQSLQSKGLPVPAPVRAMALVDTGASGSVVNPSIVQSLGIQPVGVVGISTPSTTQSVSCRQFHVDVSFPNGVTVAGAVVLEAPLGGQPIQCLIGRDILQHAVLVYVGYANMFTLCF